MGFALILINKIEGKEESDIARPDPERLSIDNLDKKEENFL